jgi:two-component system, cell cycle response regulator CpdR
MEGKRSPLVLIVEDDETVRGFLIRALESLDCKAVGVSNGEQALGLITTPPGVAAVLVDGILPDMHGYRLAERMLDQPEGRLVGICFVTGALRESTGVVAGVGALSKPVRLAELRATVTELLRWRQAGGSPLAQRVEALTRIQESFLVGP